MWLSKTQAELASIGFHGTGAFCTNTYSKIQAHNQSNPNAPMTLTYNMDTNAGGFFGLKSASEHFLGRRPTKFKEVLGKEWLNNQLFRLGTSRLANLLLSDILGQETKFF
jgi:hypothetical protein